VLARAQPDDWLDSPAPGLHPLNVAASIRWPTSQLAFDAIVASPGGFPAHAVAASRGALNAAMQFSTLAFATALVEAGADPNGECPAKPPHFIRDRPLHALVTMRPSGHGCASDLDARLALLLSAGAQLEAVDSRGWTPLVSAAISPGAGGAGDVAAFDALLAAGAQPSALRVSVNCNADARGAATYWSVLHELAGRDGAVMIARVLATGALRVDVRAGPACSRCTPLHVAAERDALRAASALHVAGASLDATDSDGFDALKTAVRFSAPKVARLLADLSPPARRTRHNAYALSRERELVLAGQSDAATLAAASAVVEVLLTS